MAHPIRHLVPLDNETGWSDLLATLIEADPAPLSQALGLGDVKAGDVRVRREIASKADPKGKRRDRIDLLVDVGGTLRCAVEVKVLSGLGLEQLRRYQESYPGAAKYLIVAPAQFPLPAQDNPGWQQGSWEELLSKLATSGNVWVRDTARAWLDHMNAALPQLAPQSRWDDLQVGDPFPLMLRARTAWVHQHLPARDGLTVRLVQATGSNKWVTRMHAPCIEPGYQVVAEVEDATNVRSKHHFPKVMSADTPPPEGPEFRVFLEQTGVETSADFSWRFTCTRCGRACRRRPSTGGAEAARTRQPRTTGPASQPSAPQAPRGTSDSASARSRPDRAGRACSAPSCGCRRAAPSRRWSRRSTRSAPSCLTWLLYRCPFVTSRRASRLAGTRSRVYDKVHRNLSALSGMIGWCRPLAVPALQASTPLVP